MAIIDGHHQLYLILAFSNLLTPNYLKTKPGSLNYLHGFKPLTIPINWTEYKAFAINYQDLRSDRVKNAVIPLEITDG